jgi:hypothetical protein
MKKKKNYAKHLSYLMAPLFVVILCLALLVNLLVPDQEISQMENRPLAQRPAFLPASLLSANYYSDLDDWFTDQLFGRNFLIHTSYAFKKAIGIREIDDVYLGKDALIQKASEPDKDVVEKNTTAISQFSLYTEMPTTLLLAPTAYQINSSLLPAFAKSDIEQQTISQIGTDLDAGVNNVNLIDALQEHTDEQIYYKTDHHWTSLGAYYAYSAFMDSQQQSTAALSDYTIYQVSESFQGTLASKTGSFGLKDQIDIYVAKDTPDYVVTYGSSHEKFASIYRVEALSEKDQYQVFFGGNEALIHIDTLNGNGKNLLLLKDSYANSLVQFLLPYYQSITLVDPRYYYDDLDTILNSYMITDTMLCFNYENFVSDDSLSDVLMTSVDLSYFEENTEEETE